MSSGRMPSLKIGTLEVKVPIIQGGMSVGISLSGLASAVANEGGIGVIGSAAIGMLQPDFSQNYRAANKRALKNEIRKAKSLTDGIVGINIMVASSDYDEMLMVAVDEGADIIFLGAGLPLKYRRSFMLDRLSEVSTRVVPIVSSARAVKIIFQYWAKTYDRIPDAVVVEGPAAGGHLGFKREQIDDPNYALEKIVPEVINVVKGFEDRFGKDIPVIAAGGIFTGADIHKFMQLGVQGVQMATRFVATHECDASIKFKEAYVRCTEDDLTIIDSPVGLPGRALKNKFLEDVSNRIKQPLMCPWKCLKTCDYEKVPYCIAFALTNAKKGRLGKGFAFAGSNAYRVNEIVSVKELMGTLMREYEEAVVGGLGR